MEIRTLADLHESSPYAFPGGYPVAFYSEGGVVMCYDCVEAELFNAEESAEGNFMGEYDAPTFASEVEDGDQQFYGGVMCDACEAFIYPNR